jgi:hypothetical protein
MKVQKKNIKIRHKVSKESLTFKSEGSVANRFYVYKHIIEVQLGGIKLSTSFKINEFEMEKTGFEELLLAQHLLEVVNLLLLNVVD